MVGVTVAHSDAYANVGDFDLAANLAEQCLAVLAQHELPESHVKPLYWRLAIWHRRAQRPAVAAAFEARDRALGDACGSALTIPSGGKVVSPTHEERKFVPLAMMAADESAVTTRSSARVLCRPTAKRSALAAFPCMSGPSASPTASPTAPSDGVLDLLPVLGAVAIACTTSTQE